MEEKERLQNALDNTKSALKRAKDDIAQKSKLLASLRAGRNNDEQALNETRSKQQKTEDQLKRARGELSRRKSQIENLLGGGKSPATQQPNAGVSGGGPRKSDDAVVEDEKENLREKLRASKMDVARAKQQAHVLRTKLEEQTLQIRDLEQQLGTGPSAEERLAGLKASVGQKEAALRAARSKLSGEDECCDHVHT